MVKVVKLNWKVKTKRKAYLPVYGADSEDNYFIEVPYPDEWPALGDLKVGDMLPCTTPLQQSLVLSACGPEEEE